MQEEKKLVPFSYFSAATQSNDGRSFVGEGLMLLLLLYTNGRLASAVGLYGQ